MAVRSSNYTRPDPKQPEYEPDAPLATSGELERFYVHLEQVLTDPFLDPDTASPDAATATAVPRATRSE